MIDPVTEARLQELLRRESRSFLQYARQANPWAGTEDRASLDNILAMSQAEESLLEELAAYLQSHHVRLPAIGAFPMAFTSYNYVSVRALFSPLVREQRKAIAALEQDRAALADPDAVSLADRLLEIKKRHLCELEKLSGAAHPSGC
ncbi:MAG TPA: hypothetical protein VIL46_15305 [Gemmataceae bacterium]